MGGSRTSEGFGMSDFEELGKEVMSLVSDEGPKAVLSSLCSSSSVTTELS